MYKHQASHKTSLHGAEEELFPVGSMLPGEEVGARVHVLCALVLFTDWKMETHSKSLTPGNPMDRGLASHSPWGHKKSDTPE